MMRECYIALNWVTACAEAKRRGMEMHVNVSGFYLTKGDALSRMFDTTAEAIAFMDGMLPSAMEEPCASSANF
jgi:hypothetical protein